MAIRPGIFDVKMKCAFHVDLTDWELDILWHAYSHLWEPYLNEPLQVVPHAD